MIDAANEQELHSLLDGVKIAAIGPVTAETVCNNGLQVDIQPSNYTIPDMVASIVEYYHTQSEG
jgi:uroporphyrinogen III methyltransferase/synthase